MEVKEKEEKVSARRIRYSEWFKRSVVAEYEKGIRAKKSVLDLRKRLPRLGTRKLHHLLKDEIGMGRDMLFGLFRQEGLLVCNRKHYTATTNSGHRMRKYPNQIKDLIVHRPEQVWVADITYMSLLEGPVCLHLITDALPNSSWAMSSATTWKQDPRQRLCKWPYKTDSIPEFRLFTIPDWGLQNCSNVYESILEEQGIQISMTKAAALMRMR